jgi:hypothetical protein
MGEKIVRSWSEGKKNEAVRALVELLSIEGVDGGALGARGRAPTARSRAILARGRETAEALLAHRTRAESRARQGRGGGDG